MHVHTGADRPSLHHYMIMPEEAARTSFPSLSLSLELNFGVPACPSWSCPPCPAPLPPLCAASPQPSLAKLARSPALNPCSISMDIAYVFTVFLTSTSPACPRAQHNRQQLPSYHNCCATAPTAAAPSSRSSSSCCCYCYCCYCSAAAAAAAAGRAWGGNACPVERMTPCAGRCTEERTVARCSTAAAPPHIRAQRGSGTAVSSEVSSAASSCGYAVQSGVSEAASCTKGCTMGVHDGGARRGARRGCTMGVHDGVHEE